MAGGVGSKKRNADINVVPLIDIVLVLLIIFMVITPLVVKEMDLRLPEKEEEPVETPPPDQKPPDQVILLMGADFTTYLNKEVVPREQLQERVAALMNSRTPDQRIMFFDAEDATNYGETVKVLDIARAAGVTKIGMITDRTNLAPPGAPGTPGLPGEPGAPAIPGAPPGVPGMP